MRGLYTVGVLDALMDRGFAPDYIIGVSAGAGNGISYVSGQKGRAYLGGYGLPARQAVYQPFQFYQDQIGVWHGFCLRRDSGKYDPFNYAAFLASPIEFVTGVTDVETGKPAYFGKQPTMAEQCRLLRASAAIPMFSPIVEFQGRRYLDGGTSDPIPVRRPRPTAATS